MKRPSSYQRIYAAVRRIPRGRVATYGQIADIAGLAGGARQVGYALSALPPGSGVPWQRVINAEGKVSRRAAPGHEQWQRALLVDEGILFDSSGRVSLARFGYSPRVNARRRQRGAARFRRRPR